MKKIFSILVALVLVVSLGLVTAAPVAAQITVLDHFKCYRAWGMEHIGEVVYLEDQFGAVEALVGYPYLFCNPVEKWDEEMPPSILNWDNHLTLYILYHEEEPQERVVEVKNQFGTQQLVVSSDPFLLGVPTQKLSPVYHNPPVGLDHFLVYKVIEGTPVEVVVGLYDYNFDYYEDVLVYEPVYFANPVKKTHDGDVTLIENPEAYLVFYRIASYSISEWVRVDNQFGEQELEVYINESYPALLAVPSSESEEQVTLTISSTAGGSVTTPGEATFTYDAGTVVNLVATPATDYGFVNWAGDVHTIANVNDATTIIIMQGDYEITARFLAGVVAAKTERVIDSGIVHARAEADTEVEVTGSATVTVARYYENPGGTPPTGSSPLSSLDKYIDVYSPDTKEATEFVIKLYYTDAELAEVGINETSLRLFWWNGDVWNACSDSGVNTNSNYIWAKIRNNTTPSLADLQGTPFGGYGHPTEPDGCFIATAAYGTKTAKELDILREFRNEVLLPNSLGAGFVSLYYKISPPIANFISQNEALRTAVRVGFVDPIVAILNWSHALWLARGSQ